MKRVCLLQAMLCVAMLAILAPVSALELNDVYRQLGDYRVVASGGVRVYYPNSVEDSISRVHESFIRVKHEINKLFPEQKGFEATVVLNDHDDRISSSSDADFDWINIGMFEEMGALSTRAYSLEKRFALRLSHIMILRSLAAADNSWKRRLAILAVPEWFLDGLALHFAFELDSVHFSRLLDMARHNRLYTLSRLNTVISQPDLIKEEMRFQAHSMIQYWETIYKKGAAKEILRSVLKRPTGFPELFRKHYGVSLGKAYASYVNWICDRCDEFKEIAAITPPELTHKDIGGQFFRSLHYISHDEKIWVSSRRYSTETYDLYYQNGDRRPKLLLKNVHPALMVDEFNNDIYIGKYWVNSKRQRRLALWAVNTKGRARVLSDDPGSFKPLGKRFGRIFYTAISGGITRVMSVDPEFRGSTRVEFKFPASISPLDLALSRDCRTIYYVFDEDGFVSHLAKISIVQDDKTKKPIEIYASEGDITALVIKDNELWFAADKDFYTTQLFVLNEEKQTIEKYSQLPGGVWDIAFNQDQIMVATLDKGEFWAASIDQSVGAVEKIELSDPVPLSVRKLPSVTSNKYVTEYNNSYWSPILSEDEDGAVFGIYNYRTDRLGRSNIVVAPRYGFKSENWGYLALYMQRFDLLKVQASIVDAVRKKSYMSNDYFERTRAKVLDFEYPFDLATTLSFGVDLSERSISKIVDVGNPFPTIGKDHSFYTRINHRAIRTEPYWRVFPRKGRTIRAYYKRGSDFLDGEMDYDSMGINWKEHIPVRGDWVFTSSLWAAQDDKDGSIRRPDDLSLGGTEFMRAFDDSYKSGDSLRAMTFSLGHPVKLQFPKFMRWLQNQFMIAEVFWEAGDVKNNGNYRYDFDRGIEVRMQAMLLNRIPLIIRLGQAWENSGNSTNTYVTFDSSELMEIFR